MHDHIPHTPPSAGLRRAGLIFAVVAVAVAAVGIYLRINHSHDLQKAVEARHTTVKVVAPEPGPSMQSLILPGNVSANIDAPIYARVSGYLKAWYTDIGVHVKKGQLLGIVETPELDQQILRAQADVYTAESNLEIAEVTAKRWQNLLATDSVSRQDTDEKTATAKGKRDILNAARANLQSLQAEQSFQRVVAPFTGIITERNTDVGHLINPGSNNNGQPLFRIVDNLTLRIYVEVPQNYANAITPGMKVKVAFPELPGQHFPATVINISNSIHVSSRTSTVELLMDNKSGKLFSGSYVEVDFELAPSTNVMRLPVSSLLFRRDGLQVATVGADNRVTLKHITIVNDLGRVVEVGSGIESTDRVIDSPSDSIVQGDVVVIRKTEAAPAEPVKPVEIHPEHEGSL
ncbi:MAG: RND transporter MFP subunit [Candidatus Gallionella acididurans]|uniref:RND transporter MFP subunit n=1 Tax=Candidatus Gallionella acididurans TaxID=1796491 RepID=A0A139BVE0_9PROT|nr:MAG: RND transporter MFP subunit [Candidatus Gallionella acididurans]